MSDEIVRLEIKGPVAHIILNRPEKRNAIHDEMIEGMRTHFKALETNDEVRAIILRGEGKMFCSGIDAMWLGQLGQVQGPPLSRLVRLMIEKVQSLNNLIEQIEKPVICQIHGLCQGLGLEIALACDFRISADDAKIALPEVLLGLVPDCGGTTRVTRFAGPAVAKEVVIYCEPEPAQRYYEWNLVNRVCPPDQLDKTVDDFVKVLLDRPPLTVGMAKRLIDRGAGLGKNEHMEMEAMTNSTLLTLPEFPVIMMEGFQKLRNKK